MQQAWVQQWLSQAHHPGFFYGSAAVLLAVAYLAFRLSQTIVRIGYFVMFSAVGFCLASAASLSFSHEMAPLPLLITSGVAFGLFVCALRSKVLKVVGAATVLVITQTVGSAWMKHGTDLKKMLSMSSMSVDEPPKKHLDR